MKTNSIIVTIIAILVVGFGAWAYVGTQKSYEAITNYEQCAAAGFPIMESYPQQCKTPDGRTFTDKIAVPPVAPTAILGKAVTLNVGDAVNFSDAALLIALTRLDDSRCKPGVQCIWAGELAPVFMVRFGSDVSAEVRLGTMTVKNVTTNGYMFTLQGATETAATIIVSKVPITTTIGISGYVHVGPVCPVERMPPDPNCADRPLTSAKVEIRSSTGVLVKQSVTDGQGKFSIPVGAGSYLVRASPSNGAMLPRCAEVQATVAANQDAHVDISCDSGIR